MTQVLGTPVIAFSPPWHAWQVSICGSRTSVVKADAGALWQSVQAVVSCARWSNRPFGIQRSGIKTGSISHRVPFLPAVLKTTWQVLQSDFLKTCSAVCSVRARRRI